MRISNRNYPIFNNIGKKDLTPLDQMFEYTKNKEILVIKDIISENIHLFNETINVFSTSFYISMMESLDKLKMLLPELIELNGEVTISGIDVFMQGVMFYNYKYNDVDNPKGTVIQFTNEGYPVLINCTKSNIKWANPYIINTQGVNESKGFIEDLFKVVSSLYIFKKYAEIETKHLAPKTKLKEVGCKYSNDTDHNLLFLNSTWFTNLVKSDAFKVRGHFRLQPCGPKHEDRKLIWINEFKKDGYKAPARKIFSNY